MVVCLVCQDQELAEDEDNSVSVAWFGVKTRDVMTYQCKIRVYLLFLRSLLIVSHNCLTQNLRSDCALLRCRVLLRVMAYSSFTWDKDHGRGTVLARVYAVMSGATGDVNGSTLSED